MRRINRAVTRGRNTRIGSVFLTVSLLAALTATAEARQPFEYIAPSNRSGDIDLLIGRQKTWVLKSGSELRPPAPPSDRSARTAAELVELQQYQAQRTPITATAIQYWNSGPATLRWTQMTLSLIQRDKLNPVRAARLLGVVHTAMADAVVASWDAKYAYQRRPPAALSRSIRPALPVSSIPSYPSEHAAVAEAAAAVLGSFFANDAAALAAMAHEACETRLMAGTNYRSDIEAGQTLGQGVARKAILRAASDGASAQWTGTVPTGPGLWKGTNPVEPLAGSWKPWILTSPTQLRPGPPPTFGSAQFLSELAEVKQTVANATPSQRAIAIFWADAGGTVTPPGHWFQIAGSLIARDNLSTPRAARILGLLGATVTDTAITTWETKYYYWYIRPNQADPSIITIIPTPNFPSYTSGHSTFSSASSELLAYFFPGDASQLRYMAEEAGLSRLYAGIHYRTDITAGADVGRRMAALAIQRDQSNNSVTLLPSR